MFSGSVRESPGSSPGRLLGGLWRLGGPGAPRGSLRDTCSTLKVTKIDQECEHSGVVDVVVVVLVVVVIVVVVVVLFCEQRSTNIARGRLSLCDVDIKLYQRDPN